MGHTIVKPDRRLLSAIPYLKKGGRVADIGTDHAYLPIYLVAEGYVSKALAADINEGPVESARANIARAGLGGSIHTLLTDGLHGVEDFHPDDILIFGMGGELILRILKEAPWVRDSSVGLVLQPMSRAHLLRRWLTANGFAIVGESLTREDKYYQTIHARFGLVQDKPYTEAEELLGRRSLLLDTAHREGFVCHELAVLERIKHGKCASATADTSEEERLIAALTQELEELT